MDSIILMGLIDIFLVLVLFIFVYAIYEDIKEIRRNVKEFRKEMKKNQYSLDIINLIVLISYCQIPIQVKTI